MLTQPLPQTSFITFQITLRSRKMSNENDKLYRAMVYEAGKKRYIVALRCNKKWETERH